MDKKYKVILDTDPGDDIDDVLALAYLLKSNKYEVIGILTTFKDTDKRARIVKKILYLGGYHHIPVYAGYGDPLVKAIPESQEINQYTDDLDDEQFRPDGYEEDAIDFLISACNTYKEELIVVGVAPLCNLSRALIKDKKALHLIDKTVIMGGCFDSDYPEWNLFCDSDSAKYVFENAKDLWSVGVEITSQTHLTFEDTKVVETCSKDAFYQYVGQLVKMWRETHDNHVPCLHDVLAVMMIEDDGVCEYDYKKFSVDTENNPGALIFDDVNGGLVKYVKSFNKGKFMEKFMDLWK